MVAGIFAFGGVLAAQIVAIALDYLKVRREDARRWHLERRKIYLDFIVAAEDVLTLICIDNADQNKLQEARRDLLRRDHEIALVASAKIRRKSEDIYEFVNSCYAADNDKNAKAWSQKLSDLIMEFEKMVRSELNVRT